MANGVTIDLIVDPKKAITGLGQVESRSTSLSNALGKLGGVARAGVVALGVATAAAGAGLAAFTVSSVKAAAEAEKISAQTAAVIKSTGGAAGKSSQQIDALAKSLSRVSGVEDEAVKASANVLLTFTAIKGTNFDRAEQAVLDLSQSMGKDLNSSAILVGKALNDPIKGLTALTRVGVRFTAQQKEQIAGFVKVGDVASAQRIILQELNTEFGGSAAAFGNTFEGSVGRAKNALTELKEEIGAAFLPALTSAAGSVAKIFDSIDDNPKFQAFISTLGTKLTNGLKPITDFLVTVAESPDPFGTLLNGLEKVSPAFGVIRDVFDALKPQLPKIQAGFTQVGAALGAGLAQYGPQLAVAFGEIVTALVPLIPQILTLIPPILQLIPPLVQLATLVIPPLVQGLQLLLPPLQFIVQGFAGGLQVVGDFLNLLTGNTSLAQFQKQIEAVQGPAGDLFRVALNIGNAFRDMALNIGNAIAGAISGIRGAFADAANWLVDAGKNIIQGLINGISGAVGGALDFVRGIGKNIAKAFSGILGIHSPSTVFAGFGGNVIAGLEQGLTGSNNLGSIMSSLSSQVTSGFGGALNVQARATLAAGYDTTATSAASSRVPNINMPIYVQPDEDPRIFGRKLGREFGRTIAGVT